MTGFFWAVLIIIGGFAVTAAGDMVSEEVRDRLDRLPRAILHLAAWRLDPADREDTYNDEWLPELIEILTGDEARPITRLLVGTRFALGILATARRIARGLSQPAPEQAATAIGEPATAAISLPAAIRTMRPLAGRERFLATLAGGRSDILAFCPSELGKFETLGVAVFLTGSMTAAAIWYALVSVMAMNPFLAFLAASFAGMVLTGLLRWTIISFRFDGKTKFAVAVPWLIFTMMVGIVLSTPVAIRSFQAEINNQISLTKEQQVNEFYALQQRSQVAAQVSYWQNNVNLLDRVINSRGATPFNPAEDPDVKQLTGQLTSERNIAASDYKAWQCQLYGGGSCDTAQGTGPLARTDEQLYETAETQITSLNSRIQAREAKLQATDTSSQQSRLQQAEGALPNARAQLNLATDRENNLQAGFFASDEAANGMAMRIQALYRLSGENVTLAAAWCLLFLSFLLVNCMPLVIMLVRRPGIYEAIHAAVVQREFQDALRHFRSE
jgi:hypothetical protein